MTRPAILDYWCEGMKENLQQYLALANDIRSLMLCAAEKIDYKRQKSDQTMTINERVVLGLANKMHSTFAALVEDASLGRGEAMHHLKTLVESFICLYWVGQGQDDERAEQILAWACAEKEKFFMKNQGYPGGAAYLKCWQDVHEDMAASLRGKSGERKIFELAKDSGLKEYYSRIYRLACDSAHIADIHGYLPLQGKSIAWSQPDTSELMAHVAIDYGVHLMCDLLEIGSYSYQLGLEADIQCLREKYNEVRAH